MKPNFENISKVHDMAHDEMEMLGISDLVFKANNRSAAAQAVKASRDMPNWKDYFDWALDRKRPDMPGAD